MSVLKSLFGSIKQQLADIFLGEPVREWGEIHEWQGSFFNEVLSLDLYQKDGRPLLWLKIDWKSRFSRNIQFLAIEIGDLSGFVGESQSRFDQLRRLAQARAPAKPAARDRLPFMYRLMMGAIFGIRASKQLFNNTNPRSGCPDYRFYGFVTRKAETRVLLLSRAGASKQEGTVISGDGFSTMLGVLAEFLASDEAARTLRAG